MKISINFDFHRTKWAAVSAHIPGLGMHLFSMQPFIIHVDVRMHLIIALFGAMSCFGRGAFLMACGITT